MTHWRDLMVSDADGEWGPLGELVDAAPANLDSATIENGQIVSWDGFFLSAPDEEPDWDAPRGPVDWSGFAEAINTHRGKIDEE
ncbi:MAG: hypothetical protein WC565_08530 [Parcubacteria group bacterium]